MKGIWNEKQPEDVFNTWSALLEEYNKEIKSVRNELQAHGYFEELRFEAFSDTIVISHTADIERAIEKGKQYNPDIVDGYTQKIYRPGPGLPVNL